MRRHVVLSLVPLALFACSEYEIAGIEQVPEGDDTLPVAVCNVSPNPVAPPFESAAWDGTESNDPSGGTIEKYEWTLKSRPVGSAANMPGGNATRSGFTPDLAGDYVGQLVVINDAGLVSRPCEVTLAAIPAQNLWVEMYWEKPGDDMDLHLLRGNGTLESGQDCYYANCTPEFYDIEWGTNGDHDNAFLDLDDIPDAGPENINIAEPEDTNYTVVVHDFPLSVLTGPNDVTVKIYIDGANVWEQTRSVSGEDSYEYFARIDWRSGEVTSL